MAIKGEKVESLVSSAGLSRRGGLSVRPGLSVRSGTGRDIPVILEMIRGLAEYEHLAHEVKATAARLRRDGSGRRPYFETLVCSRGRKIMGFALFFYTYSTFAGRPTYTLRICSCCLKIAAKGAGKTLLRVMARIAPCVEVAAVWNGWFWSGTIRRSAFTSGSVRSCTRNGLLRGFLVPTSGTWRKAASCTLVGGFAHVAT